MKFKIFLSSEMKHLEGVRKILKESLENINENFEVIGIDFLQKRDSSMTDCLNLLETADYYICILGQRLGLFNEEGFTGTEREVLHCRKKNIPKLFIDFKPDINKNMHRDSGIDKFLRWLKSTPDFYSDIKICNDKNLIIIIQDVVKKHYELILKDTTKFQIYQNLDYLLPFKSINKLLVREKDLRIEITERTFFDYSKALKIDYEECALRQERPDLLGKYIYLLEFITSFVKKNLNNLNSFKKFPDLINEIADVLIIFAECFNWMNFDSRINNNALWCINIARDYYSTIGNHTSFKYSQVRLMNIYYTIASKYRIDYSSSEKIKPKIRDIYLEKIINISSYLKHLSERSPEEKKTPLVASDHGYEAFYSREIGDIRNAVNIHRQFIDYTNEIGKATMYQLGEFVYTLSLYQLNMEFKKQFELIENHICYNGFSGFNINVGRRLLQTYIQMGEVKKAEKLHEELFFFSQKNNLNSELIKLNRIFITMKK